MGNVLPAIVKALSCEALWKYTLNSGRCNSNCGEICGCSCEKDLVDPGSDSEYSVDVDSCCGTAHYVTTKPNDSINGDRTSEGRISSPSTPSEE